jgi:hypothetical protein
MRTGREEEQTDGRVDKGSDNTVIFALKGRKYHNMRWGWLNTASLAKSSGCDFELTGRLRMTITLWTLKHSWYRMAIEATL